MRSTFKVLFSLKRNKEKDRKVVPVMGRISVNGSIAQFCAKLSVPETLWEVRGGHAKGHSLEADRINRHLDNIRPQIGRHYQDICDYESYVTAEKVKDTIHTTELDTDYARSVELLRKRKYAKALYILNEYNDRNTVVAHLSMDHNEQALELVGRNAEGCRDGVSAGHCLLAAGTQGRGSPPFSRSMPLGRAHGVSRKSCPGDC